MRQVHLPVWLGTASTQRARTFALLFSLATIGRSILITLIPLQALDLLRDAQAVSVLYFAVSSANLCLSLSIPWLVKHLRRRRVFTLGGLLLIAAPAAIYMGTIPTLVLGMVFQLFGVACLEITMSLYLMDHIRRQEMGHFEPMRLFYVAGVWTGGPWLGVYLHDQFADWMPLALASGAALATLCLFWFLRLQDNTTLPAEKAPPANPLRYMARYLRQPRLCLAWLLAFARSGWWAMFYVYAPILAIESGLGRVTTGAIVSIASAALFIVPLWGWVARRYGLRRLLMGAYALSGLASLAIALSAGVPWLVAAVLVAAGFATSAVDGGGNVPFLRSVRPMERAEMTTIFATYRDVSQLAPPGVFALLLKVFHLPVVFVAAGLGMAAIACCARHLPRRM